MDNNLLKQLIAQHRRVVIPDFGAFLKKETPEGEELVFSPFLRKDDGMVTEAIVREYGVETEDARGMIAEFVIYLRQSLASSGRYYIEGVGMLAADANGVVTLKEGEAPEPEPVEPEPVAEPVHRQIKPQPVPQQIQQTQGGMTRPQSIQVQGQPQTQMGQPAMPPIAPVQQMPGGGQLQQPFQRPQPVQGQQLQQPFQRPQPMPGQGQKPIYAQGQGQPPMRGGQPPIVPPVPRQPQTGRIGGENGVGPLRGGQETTGGGFRRGGGMPNPNGAGRGAGVSGGGVPGGPNGKPGQHPRRPAPPRRRPQKTKTDVWLIVAIVAALVVIAIMIYGFVNTGKNDMDELNFNMSAQPQDTTALTDSGISGTSGTSGAGDW